MLCFRQCSWNGFHQLTVTCRTALLDKCGVTADKINAHRLCTALKGMCILYRITAADSHKHGDRCNGNPLVDDRNTVFPFNILSRLDKILCQTCNLIVNLLTGLIYITVTAVQ